MDAVAEERKLLEGARRGAGLEAPPDFHEARLGPRRVGAEDFLTALFGPYYGRGMQGFIEIRVIGERGVKSYFFRGLSAFKTKRFEARTRHTFYGLLPREKKEGRKEAVKWILALWADLDAKNFPGGKEETWRHLRTFSLPPSVIVDSGHGLQALWLLEEPEAIASPDFVEGYLAGLTRELKGDPTVCELARVFRLPGSFNVKDPQRPLEVKIKFFNPRERYRLSDFERFRVEVPESPGDSKPTGIDAEKKEGLDKVLSCKFIRFAELNARDLSEPLWWSALTNLLPFQGGREKSHELSKPYEKAGKRYSFKETERKIRHILRSSPGPHTCRKIVEHGYPCSFIGTCPVEAPAGLAWAEGSFIEKLKKEPAEA